MLTDTILGMFRAACFIALARGKIRAQSALAYTAYQTIYEIDDARNGISL